MFNGARYLLAALAVLPFAGRNAVSSMPRDQYKLMMLAGLFLFIGSALQQAGMVYTTAGNAGFLTSLYVVLIPVALFLFWQEKPHWTSVGAVALAGVGAFLLSTGGRFDVHRGDVLELLGALFWTSHVIVLGKFATKFEPMSFSVGQLIVCGALNLELGIFVEPMFSLDWPIVIAISVTAFLALGLCFTLQVWAQRHTPPADSALILSLESVFAVLAGWLVLNERLSAIQVLGCALIFVAVLISQIKEWNLRGKIDHDHLVEGR